MVIISTEFFEGKLALSGLMRRRDDRQVRASKQQATGPNKSHVDVAVVSPVEVPTKPASTLLNQKRIVSNKVNKPQTSKTATKTKPATVPQTKNTPPSTATSSLCQPLPWPELPAHTFNLPGSKDFKEAWFSFSIIFLNCCTCEQTAFHYIFWTQRIVSFFRPTFTSRTSCLNALVVVLMVRLASQK